MSTHTSEAKRAPEGEVRGEAEKQIPKIGGGREQKNLSHFGVVGSIGDALEDESPAVVQLLKIDVDPIVQLLPQAAWSMVYSLA